MGRHLPRHRGADPAPRGRAPRDPPRLRDLRPRGPGNAGAGRDPPPRAPRGRLQARRGHRPHLGRQECAGQPRGVRPRRGLAPRAHPRRAVRAGPGRAALQRRPRLRRPDRRGGVDVPRPPRGRRALRPALRARAGRRVPGHQPRPVPPGRGAGRPAPQPVRGRRRRSVDLWLARRRPLERAGLRARLPGCPGAAPGAELPLDRRDPRCRQRGHRPQPLAQGQDPVERARARSAAVLRAGRRRGRGGAPRAARARGAPARRGALRRMRGAVPHQRAIARARDRAAARRHSLRDRGRGRVLPAARGQGSARLPAPDREPGRPRGVLAGVEHAAPAPRRPARGAAASSRRRRWRRWRAWGRGRAPRRPGRATCWA